MSPTARLRWCLAVVTCVVVVLGLAVTRLPSKGGAGLVDAAGDTLYAVMMVLVVAFVAPRARPWVSASAALAVCAAVEVAQLTGGPAALVEAWGPARYVVGTTFSAPDLLAYAVGSLMGLLVLSRLTVAVTGRGGALQQRARPARQR